MLRTGRKDLALATFLLDSLKAGLAALGFSMVAGPEAGVNAFGQHADPQSPGSDSAQRGREPELIVVAAARIQTDDEVHLAVL